MTSQFALSLHVLGFLAWNEERGGDPVTSRQMAESINTNPVVVRRLLGDLRRAGLVETQRGAGGGVSLNRAPEAITLRQVYESVTEAPLFCRHPNPPDRSCFVGGQIEQVLCEVFTEAEEALKAKLADLTIADVYREVASRAHACRCDRTAAVSPLHFTDQEERT